MTFHSAGFDDTVTRAIFCFLSHAGHAIEALTFSGESNETLATFSTEQPLEAATG